MSLSIETAAVELHATMPTWLQDLSLGELLGLFVLAALFIYFSSICVSLFVRGSSDD